MKKFVSIVAIIALVTVLSVCLVACNASNYKSRLEDSNYYVVVNNDDSIGVTALEAELSAFGGYKAGVDWLVSGVSKDNPMNSVFVVKFDKLSDAKKFEKNRKGFEKVYRTGNYVIYGSAEAVKAAK
ncbi:MAG: hypothetical protein RSA24_01225 [Clostridia bacterium]